MNAKARVPDPKPFEPIYKTKVKPSVFANTVTRFHTSTNPFKIDNHVFQTDDGYNLLCFRIRLVDSTKWNKKVVLLNHGFCGSSDSWFLHKESIGMYFVRLGYDFWALNHRGNKYNLSHKNKDISPKEFFDFTIHDIATKDIPTVYKNVLRVSQAESLVNVTFALGGELQVLALVDENTRDYISSRTERSIF